MDITSLRHNRLFGSKIYYCALFLLISFTNFSLCQINYKFGSEGIRNFNNFIDLFYTIPDNDSTLIWQQIEYTTCPHTIIDSSFCSFVDIIPYFYPYAIFKVECPNGILVCIQHVCPSEMADLQFVEFLTFDTHGVLKNRMALPYRKNGCLTGDFEDITQLYVSKDKLQVIVERVFYGKSSSQKMRNSIYNIDDNGTLILVHE